MIRLEWKGHGVIWDSNFLTYLPENGNFGLQPQPLKLRFFINLTFDELYCKQINHITHSSFNLLRALKHQRMSHHRSYLSLNIVMINQIHLNPPFIGLLSYILVGIENGLFIFALAFLALISHYLWPQILSIHGDLWLGVLFFKLNWLLAAHYLWKVGQRALL